MKLTKNELIDRLKHMITLIEADDSFEGGIDYTCMLEEVPCERGEFEVKAFYRMGNSEGQGGCCLIEATPIPFPVDDT